MYYLNSKIVSSQIPSFFVWFIYVVLLTLVGMLSLIFPVVTFIGFCSLLILLPLLLKPEYALYTFAVVLLCQSILNIFIFKEVVLNIAQLTVIILIFSWVFARLLKTRNYISGILAKQHVYYFLFFSWALLSLFWSSYKLSGIGHLLNIFLAMCLVYISSNILINNKTLRTCFLFLIFIGILNAIATLLYPYFDIAISKKFYISDNIYGILKFWSHGIGHSRLGRARGFSLAHYTATYSVIPIFCSITMFFITQDKRRRFFFMLFSVIMFSAIIATMSKTPIFSALIGIIYVFYHIKPLKRFFIKNIFKLLILVIILFCFVRIQNIYSSFQGYLIDLNIISSPPERTTSLSNRKDVIKLGLEVLYNTKGFGCGVGSFRPIAKANGLTIDCSHPMVLFELGFIGFMLWSLLLISAYFLFIRTLKNTASEYYRRILIIYNGGYVCLLINWFFSASYTNIYLWFYLGIGYALVHMSKNYPMKEVPLPFHKPGDTIVDI